MEPGGIKMKNIKIEDIEEFLRDLSADTVMGAILIGLVGAALIFFGKKIINECESLKRNPVRGKELYLKCLKIFLLFFTELSIVVCTIIWYICTITTVVPDVRGMPLKSVEAKLEAKGLVIESIEGLNSDEIKINQVISVNDAIEWERNERLVAIEGKRVKRDSLVVVAISLGREIIMPDVRGKSKDEAEKELENKGLEVTTVKEEYSNKYSKGQIMSQSQKPKAVLNEGDSVTLTVSKGAKPFGIRRYIGEDLTSVRKEIKKLGLVVAKTEREYDFNIEKGKIIQQSPKEGTIVTRGDKLKFTISKGAPKMPDLHGLNENEAKDELKKIGLESSKITCTHSYNDTVAKGKVLEQSIKDGKAVKTSVEIKISDGPAPVPAKNVNSGGGTKKVNGGGTTKTKDKNGNNEGLEQEDPEDEGGDNPVELTGQYPAPDVSRGSS